MSNLSFLLPADPKAGYLAHKEDIDLAVRRVLDSGWYILGQEVSAFEQGFAEHLGVKQVVGTGSGTDALQLALLACGIGDGDFVLTVSHTAVATVAAIELVGATPLLVDIDPISFTMHPDRLEDAIKKCDRGKVKAIIPVHLYGYPADMPAIMDIANRYGLYVIEDCAQSHGATIQGRMTGTWGHLAAFSFYPTKNLGALGDGGAVATNDAQLADKARLLQQYGWKKRYVSDIAGMNTRLDEIQAAILRVKLIHLDKENERRRDIAQYYGTVLSSTALVLPVQKSNIKHVYHQYVVRSALRDELSAFLKDNSIGTAILYPVPVHLQPAYLDRIPIGVGGLRETEQICQEILSLPLHPYLTEDQVRHIGELVVKWDEQRGED